MVRFSSTAITSTARPVLPEPRAGLAADGLDDDHLHPRPFRLGVEGPERRPEHRPAVDRGDDDRERGGGGRRILDEASASAGVLSRGDRDRAASAPRRHGSGGRPVRQGERGQGGRRAGRPGFAACS